jgi:transcriptional regulator with XRE-family HTH domain/tetratricopeptide (TPR) repeat protein
MKKKSSQPFFASPLAQARHERGWTQEQVAAQLNTDANTYSRWERGKHRPSAHYLARLSALFARTPEALGFFPERPTLADPSATDMEQRFCDLEIPPPPIYLIGREQEREHLKRRLCRPLSNSMTALTGLPGVGKTTLARALAHDPDLRRYFSGGILWANLGTQPSLNSLLRHWGTVLGLTDEHMNALPDYHAWKQCLRQQVGTHRILFILDDAWNLDEVLALSIGGRHCATLVTTRSVELATRLSREESMTLSELSSRESLHVLQLFIPRLLERETALVQQVVQAVGGLPLALTLIGQYLRLQAASGQPRRFQHALTSLLAAPARLHLSEAADLLEQQGELEGHQSLSLWQVIALSEQRLSAHVRQALYALSILPAKPSSFPEGLAEAVMATEAQVLDTLVDAGLVESVGEGRYSLHQTIADYARLRLQEEQQETPVQQRFLEAIHHLLRMHSADVRALLPERELIQTAIRLAAALQHPERLVHLVCAAVPFALVNGNYKQAHTWLTLAQDATREVDNPSLLAHLWLRQGELAQKQGQAAQAAALFQEGLRVAQGQEDVEQRCELLTGLVEVECQRGHLRRACTYGQEALALLSTLKREDLLCRCWLALGAIWHQQGEIPLARQVVTEMLTLTEQLHREDLQMYALLQQGQLDEDAGDFSQAYTQYQEALTLAKRLEAHEGICAALVALCRVQLLQGMVFDEQHFLLTLDARPLARVQRRLEQARAEGKRLGHTGWLCQILILEGMIARQREDWMVVELRCGEALLLAQHLEYPLIASAALLCLGEAALQQQRYQDAQALLLQAHQMIPAGHAHRGWAEVQLARVAAAQGDIQEARRYGLAAANTFAAIDFYATPHIRRWVDQLPEPCQHLHCTEE